VPLWLSLSVGKNGVKQGKRAERSQLEILRDIKMSLGRQQMIRKIEFFRINQKK
jgi:hypothetical protein